MVLPIFIPTAGRANRQITLQSLPRDPAFPIYLVVPGDEIEAYDHLAEELVTLISMDTRAHPRIRGKRNFILDYCAASRYDRLVMMDDDLRFRRRPTDHKKFRVTTPTDVSDMLGMIDYFLHHHAHVGVSDEFMSQHNPTIWQASRRYNQVLAYNLAKWPKEVLDAGFRLEINEEHDLHLQLATRGLPPAVLTDFTKGSTFYASGGCSTWRTAEMELEAHQTLAYNFPGLVKVVSSSTSLSGYAIRVQWAKAGRLYDASAAR